MGEWRIEGVPATFRIEEEAVIVHPKAAAPKTEPTEGAEHAAEEAPVEAHAADTEVPPAPENGSAKPTSSGKQTLVIVFDESIKNIESRVFHSMIVPMQKYFNEALRAQKKTIADFPPPPRTARAVPPAQQAAHAAEVAAENARLQAENEAAGHLAAQPSAHRTSAERAGLRPPRPTAHGPIAAPQAAPRGHRPAPATASMARRPAGTVPNLGVKR